ncbi:MAG: type VI secretion system tip protein TssI/VgrG [Gammaproteobacteria bacterium]
MPAPAANRSRFSLAIKGVRDEIRVTGFSGHAEISGLYTYDISIASKRANLDLKSWLDQPATLTLHGDPDRHIHGLIMEASHTGQGREFTDYRITIVPRLWRLTQSKNNRIFQDKTANQIITLLLREHGITGAAFQDHTPNASQRHYCVQFGESDFAFVSRLMDEEGWHFHFHQQKDNHILVMADRNKVFASKSGSPQIRYEQETSRADGVECIRRLDDRHQITTGAVRLGDFDFTKPGLTLREHLSGSNASLEHYDHPGLFDDPVLGKKRARLRLEQAECQRQSIRMETHATTLDAGQWFQLHSHPNGTVNRQYLVTRVAISGTQSQAYGEGAADSEEPFRCSIDCIPWQTEFRPPHVWRKPTIKGPHSAIVTGPKGEEIYTDQHGRIKVQFHWNREGQADDTTSCWVRVNQPVSGIQWGGISIPRVGQEVIVEFEHGDPDRPIVVGRVYNGQSQPPYPLPQHKTRSVLKTLSSPGGGGYHEIRIEDKKGSEQIFLRAEKDAEIRVLNQRRTYTGNNQHVTIGNDDFAEYNAELHQTVGAALHEQIGQNLSVTVGQGSSGQGQRRTGHPGWQCGAYQGGLQGSYPGRHEPVDQSRRRLHHPGPQRRQHHGSTGADQSGRWRWFCASGQPYPARRARGTGQCHPRRQTARGYRPGHAGPRSD